MDINFSKLLDVDIFHEYYKDGISKDFVITPSDECKNILKDYRLIFHKTSTGFNVSYSGDKNAEPVIPIDSRIKLVFFLTPLKPYFLNYSDLPIDKLKNVIYYFSNYNLELPDRSTLHKESDYISAKDRIGLKSESFSTQFTSEKNEIEVSILDFSGNTIISKSFRTNENVADIQVDLLPFSPGKFKLIIDGNEGTEFYADNTLPGKAVFGVIEIFMDFESIVPQTYEIKFPYRKTFWKYNVILKHSTTLAAEDISIDIPKAETDKFNYTFADELIKNKNIEPKVLFDRLPELESFDSPSCVPFVFSKELPLTEESIKGIRLVKINGNGESDYGNPVIENLSNPSITSIKPDKDADKVYSEINVYI